jgi:cyclic pyranopterin phosphate synthase
VKASGVAPVVSLTTNGLLAARAPDGLFEVLDAITVSIYPGAGLDETSLAALRARAREAGVEVNEKRQDTFQAMTRAGPAEPSVTRAVFERCWLRHRCHTLRDGALFACSRPPSLDGFLDACGTITSADGLSLEPRPSLAAEVRAYLERDEPFRSCASCLGGTGAFVPFRQLGRDEVRLRRPE